MSNCESEVVLGADIGGTSTRVVIAETSDGRLGDVLAVARGGAGNPNAVGLTAAAEQIASVATQARDRARALGRCEGEHRVSAVVIGMAGYGSVGDRPAFLSAALPGLDPGLVRVVPDFSIAFASATPEPAGYVVLAGTGAGAVEIVDGELTGRRDAWGWLLGDLGSGFWIGREAVRSTLALLERRQPLGPLGSAVLEHTGALDLEGLVAGVYTRTPIWLASLAPVVAQTAASDPEARRIAERAADLLMDSLLSLDPVPDRPVVTTGSVLRHHTVVADQLLAAIRSGLGNPVRHATSGLVGALWIAAHGDEQKELEGTGTSVSSTSGTELDREAEHARLVAAVSAATPS